MDPSQNPQYPPMPEPTPAPAEPVAPVAPTTLGASPQASEDPGATLGIISLIMPFTGLGVVGLVLGIIAKNKSKAAGHKNSLATAGIIVSIISIVLSVIIFGFMMLIAFQMAQKCQQLGPGVHEVNGTTYTCEN